MYLLDTNVLSELRPGKAHASPAVLAWAASVPHNQHFISVVTVCEHEMGSGYLYVQKYSRPLQWAVKV